MWNLAFFKEVVYFTKVVTKTGSRLLFRQRRDSSKKDVKLYCLCQQPDDGRFMICCDNWFHGDDVGVVKPARGLLAGECICPSCSTQPVESTPPSVVSLVQIL